MLVPCKTKPMEADAHPAVSGRAPTKIRISHIWRLLACAHYDFVGAGQVEPFTSKPFNARGRSVISQAVSQLLIYLASLLLPREQRSGLLMQIQLMLHTAHYRFAGVKDSKQGYKANQQLT